MGWIGAAIPEEFGGAGLGYEGLCVLAEEMGRAVAPVPFASTAYLAAEAILTAGSDAQRREWLPKLADGSLIGCLALAEGNGNPEPAAIHARVVGGRLTGAKWPVADGGIADIAVVVARDEHRQPGLFLADLATFAGATLQTLDPTRNQARLDSTRMPVEQLGSGGWGAVQRVLDRAAILFAFEQVGGADACLQMAREYAHGTVRLRPADRIVPGDQAQAGGHVRRARAGALQRLLRRLGAGARTPTDLPLAAATARVSATEAFHLASKENIQTHGGIGFTWAVDCHLFYRRSKQLGLGDRTARRSGRTGWSICSKPATRPKETSIMDFNDTPEEAAFRAEARAFLTANAEPQGRRQAGAAAERHRRRGSRSAARPGRRRRPMPGSPASPGRNGSAGAKPRRSCR